VDKCIEVGALFQYIPTGLRGLPEVLFGHQLFQLGRTRLFPRDVKDILPGFEIFETAL
jgi:hypothetical protein